MLRADRSAIVYLTRNGLLEPLGQSQVFSYLKGLSRDYSITLITHEKPADLADTAQLSVAREDCDRCGIRWLPQRFRARPKVLAPAVMLLHLVWLAWRQVGAGRAQLIHARSYIPAAVALAVHQVTGVPFIFDMRALWPEELITAGRLRRGSIMHRAITWCERACLRKAAAVVSLTEAAADYLRETYPEEIRGQTNAVIRTCADLERFCPAEGARKERPELRFGCCGTVVSGWFRMDWLGSLYRTAADRWPEAEFEIVSRDPADLVEKRSRDSGIPIAKTRIYSANPDDMPEILRRETVNVMLYAGGETSELGRSPTRMAEVLGCGRPVIANPGVGDVAAIVERYRVGVLMNSDEPAEISRVLDELEILLADPELPARCRRAAEEVFSLESGVAGYRDLYRAILEEESGPVRRG